MKTHTVHYRDTGAILYTCEAGSFRECVERAVREGVSLSYTNLAGADLSDADLSRADLSRAYLTGADLAYADLTGAHLAYANLSDANLTYTNLAGADLSRADLSRAYLTGANLADADLTGAHLAYADLSGTVLDPTNKPNGLGDFAEQDGELVGYRTRRSMHCGETVYEDGREYVAPVFSTCPVTACHPGLYAYPRKEDVEREYPGQEMVEIRASRSDLHGAGGKFRFRRFRVVGEVAS